MEGDCGKHPGVAFGFVCESCKQLVCYECAEDHAEHRLLDLCDYIEKQQKEVAEELQLLSAFNDKDTMGELNKLKAEAQKLASQIIEKAKFTEVMTQRVIKQKAAEKERLREETVKGIMTFQERIAPHIAEIQARRQTLDKLKKSVLEEEEGQSIVAKKLLEEQKASSTSGLYKDLSKRYVELKSDVKKSEFNPIELLREAMPVLAGKKPAGSKGRLKDLLNNIPQMEVVPESGISKVMLGMMGVSEELAGDFSKMMSFLTEKGWLFLEGVGLTDGMMAPICSSLKGNEKLEGVWLDNNNITDVGLLEITKVLKEEDSKIVVLSLEGNQLSSQALAMLGNAIKDNQFQRGILLNHNMIGDEGCKGMKDLVEARITVLLLGDNKITAAGAKHMKEALQMESSLHVLWLEDNDLGDEGVGHIAEALAGSEAELECLSLSGTNCTAKGIKPLCAAFEKLDKFRGLMLNRNMIGVEGASYLAEVLPKSSMAALSLSDCGLGDEGVITLLGCGCIPQLNALWLHGNNITNVGAKALAKYLREEENSLKLLSLRRNKLMSLGAEELAAGLTSEFNILEALSLGCNEIGSEGVKAVLEKLAENTTLNSLDLSSNLIGNEGAAAVARHVATNSTIRMFYLMKCGIEDKGAEHLGDALPKSNSLQQLFLDANPIGEDGMVQLSKGLAGNTSLQVVSLRNEVCVNTDGHMFIFMRTLNMEYTRVDDIAMFIAVHELMEDRAKESAVSDPSSIPHNKVAESIFKTHARPGELRILFQSRYLRL